MYFSPSKASMEGGFIPYTKGGMNLPVPSRALGGSFLEVLFHGGAGCCGDVQGCSFGAAQVPHAALAHGQEGIAHISPQ